MKNLMRQLFLIVSISFITITSYSQYTVTDMVPSYQNISQCSLDVSMTFSLGTSNPGSLGTIHQFIIGSGNTASNFYASINWGDNSALFNTTGGASNSSGAITMNPGVTHTYTSPGVYTIVTSFISSSTQSVVVDSVQVTLGGCPATLYPYVAIDCNNDGTPESNLSQGVPVVITSSNGLSYTGLTVNNSVSFPSVVAGTYNLTIDQGWLAQNGYYIISSQANNLIQIPGTSTVAFILGCIPVTGFNLVELSPSPTSVYDCNPEVTMGFAVNSTVASNPNFDFFHDILGTNFNGFQGQILINWGDGITGTYYGGTSTQGSILTVTPAITHLYTTPGDYSIISTVINSQNQTWASDTVVFHFGNCTTSVYTAVQLDCNADGVIDSNLNTYVPFTLSNGSSTFTPSSTLSGMSQFANLPAGTYSINIDSNWLLNAGYTIGSIVPSGQLITTGQGAYTILITLNCIGNTTTLCSSGMVYCDSNSNGIYDQGEYLISNAPVLIYNASSGSVVTTNTSTQGYYFQSFQGTPGDTLIATVSQAWLTAMGYTLAQPNGYQFGASMCNSGANNNVNIGVNCNGFQYPTLCYSGIVFCDANGNGIYDNSEYPLAGAPITLFGTTATANTVTVYSNPNGYFSYCGSIPMVTSVAMASISTSWLNENGYSMGAGSNVFTVIGSNSNTTTTLNIAVNCGGSTLCSDLWTTVTPWIGYYQGTNAHIRLNWGNYGPGATNYTLSLSWPAGVTLVTSSIQNAGYTITGNTITWNLNSASTFFSSNDVLIFQVPTGLSSGTMHYFTSTIAPTGTANDCYTGNNSGTLLQIVGNSYDPNMKSVERNTVYSTLTGFDQHAEWVDVNTQDEFVYTVQFQNTGTAPAQNIVVIDTLSANLDWSTFELVEASYPVNVVNLGSGVFRFEFNQIWLADSTSDIENSHGHFIYRIRELEGNGIGSEIRNTAHIFFDWNEAIVTNTTVNVNQWIEAVDEFSSNEMLVFPNPATTEIQVNEKGNYYYEIFDVTGRQMHTGFGVNTTRIAVDNLSIGVYELVVIQDGKRKNVRFIKQ